MQNIKKYFMTLALLLTAVTGAWAEDNFYLVVDGTSATLKYDGNKGTDDPYLSIGAFGNSWANAETSQSTATTITVDATCKNFQGTSLSALFFNFTALTSINNLENLNMANVTNISGMFRQCSSLTAIDVSSFNTAQVTNMNFLFMGCTSLTTLDLSNFNTASVTTMNQMFDGCSLLENIYVGDGWSTAAVTTSNNMFRKCSKLPNFDANKVDKTNAHTGEGGYLKVKPVPTEWELKPDADKKVWTLAKMLAYDVELQVEYEPTKVTMAANDKTMGTVEVGGENKVEWTADTWKNWTSSNKVCTVDDITVTSTESASINEWTNEDKYLHSLFFYVSREDNNSTVTISTTGDPFSRIEFTMIDDYAEDKYIENKGWLGNPVITPKENWTFSGKSAVWEGEATKSLKLQSCTTWVSKITFFKSGVPDGVTVNTDGTFTVAKTATVTLTATPAEGYKFLYWEDDHSNTNPVREVTIESGMADMTYKAVFAEPTFNVTFVEGTNLNEWTATPNTEVKKDTKVDIKYNGTKKVIGVKAAKKADNTYQKWDNDQKKLVATEIPAEVTTVENADQDVNWAAGTYLVEGEVTINGKISLNGNVNLIIKDGAKLTVNKYIYGGSSKYNLSIYGQANQTGQLVVNCSDENAIMSITTLEVHSCKVKATSSKYIGCGFLSIVTFNVYGGSVDAESTGTLGSGISLASDGSMNIYGGDVKAVGKGAGCYGIAVNVSPVTVYGGKLWAENADDKALSSDVTLTKGDGFTGKIETSSDGSSWTEYTEAGTPETKYVRVGY